MVSIDMMAHKFSLIVFASLLVSACTQSVNPSPISSAGHSAPAIIGGADVAPEDSLRDSVALLTAIEVDEAGSLTAIRGVCTGALIGPDLILTAGHCIKALDLAAHDRIMFSVYFGDVDMNQPLAQWWPDESRWFVVNPSEFRVHDQYQEGNAKDGTTRNDFALLRLATKIGSNLKPLPFLPGSKKLDANAKILAVGYGPLAAGDAKSFRLRKLELTQHLITKTDFFFTNYDASGLTKGDSGGPGLIVENGRAYIFGVASMATSDQRGLWSLYSPVDKVMPWIQKTMKKLSSNPSP
jgi:secreted trypsin-like serine protease